MNKLNNRVAWLREKAAALNLAYIKHDLLGCANEIQRFENVLIEAEQTLSLILAEGADDKPDIDDHTAGELRVLLHRIRAVTA